MSMTIPEIMQAVLLQAQNVPLVLGPLPVPQPRAGQVLIHMAAAPINPSDLGFIRGSYGYQHPFPVIPGFEGSGMVIAAGAGLLPRLWLGRRVAVSAPTGGTWAEYMVAPALSCIPLRKRLSLEQGATLLVNPMTALAFFDIARQGKHAALINNAAASALGRMIVRLGQRYGVPIINIVRRSEQVELLRSMGAKYVLNSTDADFLDTLHRLSHQLNATLVLDPVGGEMVQQLLSAAPHGSTLLMYGVRSGMRGTPTQPGNERIEGFFLPEWMSKQHPLQVLLNIWRVQQLASNELQTTTQKRLPLSEVQQAIELYRANPTAGKLILLHDVRGLPQTQ